MDGSQKMYSVALARRTLPASLSSRRSACMYRPRVRHRVRREQAMALTCLGVVEQNVAEHLRPVAVMRWGLAERALGRALGTVSFGFRKFMSSRSTAMGDFTCNTKRMSKCGNGRPRAYLKTKPCSTRPSWAPEAACPAGPIGVSVRPEFSSEAQAASGLRCGGEKMLCDRVAALIGPNAPRCTRGEERLILPCREMMPREVARVVLGR